MDNTQPIVHPMPQAWKAKYRRQHVCNSIIARATDAIRNMGVVGITVTIIAVGIGIGIAVRNIRR